MTDNLSALEQRQLAWQQRRHAELSSPDSWLGLIALTWLEAGANSVGADPACAVVLPTGPALLGHLVVTGTAVVWRAAPGGTVQIEGAGPDRGEGVALATDRDGAPSTVSWGDLKFFVIEREGRLAVRLRDRAWAARQPLADLEYFPFAPAWRIEADWQAVEPPLTMQVPNVSGELKEVTVSWQAMFRHGEQVVTLLPMEVGDDHVFFIFRDGTSGRISYGAGRFLRTRPARDGRILLDFNRAYNPPCAFTPFATCPLPPPENWLPFPVEAGEKKYQGGH